MKNNSDHSHHPVCHKNNDKSNDGRSNPGSSGLGGFRITLGSHPLETAKDNNYQKDKNGDEKNIGQKGADNRAEILIRLAGGGTFWRLRDGDFIAGQL